MSGYKHSRLETANTKPAAAEIGVAEIAINLVDKILYTKDHNGVVIPVGGSEGSNANLTAVHPYSGNTQFNEFDNNFIFEESTDFKARVTDTNKYVKLGDTTNKIATTYGEELVTNGTFGTDLSGWTAVQGTINSVGSECVFSDENGVLTQTLSMIVGKTYTLNFDYDINNGNSIRVNPDGGPLRVVATSGSGSYSLSFVATSNQVLYFYGYLGSGATCSIDNVSVKEIITVEIDMLDYIPEVVVQDQTTDGLTTQVDVASGDYVVVDAAELVFNGLFDTDSSGWANPANADSTLSVVANRLRVTNAGTGGGFGYAYQVVTTVVGETYVASMKASIGTGSDYPVWLFVGTSEGSSNLGSTPATNVSVSPMHSVTFVATSTTTHIHPGLFTTTLSVDMDFDNISVKEVLSDEVYKNTTDSTILAGANIPTAFTSHDHLPISNQVIALHTMYRDTEVYAGITNHILMVDAYAGETSKSIMAKNGFSEVSEGLYSKGEEVYSCVGYWQTLNKGVYHPTFNPSGCDYTVRGDNGIDYADWHKPTGTSSGFKKYDLLSVADTFGGPETAGTGTVGGGSGRPDDKFYDIIYKDQFIDLREYSFKADKLTLDRMVKDKEFNGVSGMVETIHNSLDGVMLNVYYSSPNGWTYFSFDNGQLDHIVGNVPLTTRRFIVGNSGKYYLMNPYENTTLYANYGDVSSDFTDGQPYVVVYVPSIANNSTGTSLTIDLIGDPADYPVEMTNRLAEDKGLFGINPLLVGQDGADYTSGVILCINRAKIIGATFHSIVFSPVGSDDFLTVTGLNVDNILNSRSSTYNVSQNMYIAAYTSQNLPLQIQDPLPIIVDGVKEKVIFTNSHSILKGASYGNMIGKIQTSDTGDGLESDYLRSVEVSSVITIEVGEPFTAYIGDVVFIGYSFFDGGIFAERLLTDLVNFTYANPIDLTVGANWTQSSALGTTTPNHSTTTLAGTTSGSKYFMSIAEKDGILYSQIMQEEIIDGGDTGDFTQLTNGTKTDFNGATVKTVVASTPLNIRS